jgi:hypothetical protein
MGSFRRYVPAHPEAINTAVEFLKWKRIRSLKGTRDDKHEHRIETNHSNGGFAALLGASIYGLLGSAVGLAQAPALSPRVALPISISVM